MKKNKNIALIIIVIIIWSCVMLIFYKEEVQSNKEKVPQYVVLDSNFFWKYQDGKWSNLRASNELETINWNKFDIYIDNNFYNTYSYVYTSNKAYFFDENKNSKKVASSNMLINHNSFMSVLEYKEIEFNDDDYNISIDFLEDIDIKNTNLTITKKFLMEDDNFIYIVSNYKESLEENDVYYVVFYRKRYKNYLVVNGEYDHNYNLYAVIDINKKFNNIILSYNCYDGYCYQMFQYDNEYFNVIGD